MQVLFLHIIFSKKVTWPWLRLLAKPITFHDKRHKCSKPFNITQEENRVGEDTNLLTLDQKLSPPPSWRPPSSCLSVPFWGRATFRLNEVFILLFEPICVSFDFIMLGAQNSTSMAIKIPCPTTNPPRNIRAKKSLPFEVLWLMSIPCGCL